MRPEDEHGPGEAAPPGCHDLGDGKTAFRDHAGRVFRLGLMAFFRWRCSLVEPLNEDGTVDGYAVLDRVVVEVRRLTGAELDMDQADRLLHAVEVEWERVKHFRACQLESARSSGSTS